MAIGGRARLQISRRHSIAQSGHMDEMPWLIIKILGDIWHAVLYPNDHSVHQMLGVLESQGQDLITPGSC